VLRFQKQVSLVDACFLTEIGYRVILIYMKTTSKLMVGSVAGMVGFLVFVGVSLAGGLVLSNSGLGQKVGDTTNFGVAVCDNGNVAVTTDIPISVAANGATSAAKISAPIMAGACGYAYLSYAAFNMTAGNTYSVQAVIDPANTLGATIDGGPASYTVIVPSTGHVLGASAVSDSTRTSLLAQLAGMISTLEALLAKAKAMGL